MPDIQMFGLTRVQAADVQTAFDDAPYKAKLTFIQGPEIIWGIDMMPQRFVRVSATKQFNGLGDIIARLHLLNIDVEVMALDDFLPAGA